MINLSKRQWGGALIVSLLALSLALAGCSEPEVEGSDITGTWSGSVMSDYITFECTFNSDGTCSASMSSTMEVEGTWSLNGTTVAIDASGTYVVNEETVDVSVTQTYTYNDSAATLAATSITITAADGTSMTMSLPVTLTRQ